MEHAPLQKLQGPMALLAEPYVVAGPDPLRVDEVIE
jgi:hypothetical protein